MNISSFSRRRFLLYASLSALATLASACGSAPATAANPTPTPQADAPAATPIASVAENVVTYNGSGFTPAEIRIKAGDAVIFRNDSSEPVWVASNPHPVHTDYPGFDSRKTLAQGESYSFTFEKQGTFGYHNHLHPNQGGTVVVE
ncbi:MAG: cupredoxin domain-containing protein [Anaerolineae bacterium]